MRRHTWPRRLPPSPPCFPRTRPAVVSTPADVVKTRLMSQDPAAPLYRGALHCLSVTLRAGARRARPSCLAAAPLNASLRAGHG